MKINGIIAEYNPNHTRHLYQISQCKAITEADYSVVVMSGNYVQRGEPAILDKYSRAQMALLGGADLVIELPTYYATSSAEIFAKGAVCLLESLGVVTNLCFGSEWGDLCLLSKVADFLCEEPDHYVQFLKEGLQIGMNYPAARNLALKKCIPELETSQDVLSSPNNILAIEYLKALSQLNSSMQPVTLKRMGAEYHEATLSSTYCSATALRSAIEKNISTAEYLSFLPKSSATILQNYLAHNQPITLEDFQSQLHYKLLCEAAQGFSHYADVTADLSDRICNRIYEFTGYENFCGLLKTKEITYSRISRCLLHILLDITKEEELLYASLKGLPYLRILGFRKDALPLLGEIKKNTVLPMITKLADAQKLLDPDILHLLKNDIKRSSLYESTAALKSKHPMRNEYQIPIVIV